MANMFKLREDLDNCMLNFDRKVIMTNLLDKYGGQLELIAKIVNDFLKTEETNGKKYLKTFLLRGLRLDSEDEVITLVPEEKLKEREHQLRDTSSLLYSAEADSESQSPPTEFLPLKHISIKLSNLEVKPDKQVLEIPNGHSQVINHFKEEKSVAKKTGPMSMFKKQEATTYAAAKKSPVKSLIKKEDTQSSGSLGALFKKQQESAASKKETMKKSTEVENNSEQETTSAPEKSTIKKRQEVQKSAKIGKNSPDVDKQTKKPETKKPPTPKKMNDFFKKEVTKKSNLDSNVSVNLFEENSSSEDEETIDALKREVLTNDEESKIISNKKRRRIVDSDDENTGPEVKVERREEAQEDMETEEDEANESATYLDEDGFVVTIKSKNNKSVTKSTPISVMVKEEKQFPTTTAMKDVPSKTPVAKKKQGNIMSFFKKN